MATQNTCPVCMTKMKLHTDGHTKICPECGYKLCDHTYSDRDLYDTNHSHNDYITYASNDNQRIPDPVFPKTNLPNADGLTGRTTPANISPEDQRKKRRLRLIIIGYFIFIIWAILSGAYR